MKPRPREQVPRASVWPCRPASPPRACQSDAAPNSPPTGPKSCSSAPPRACQPDAASIHPQTIHQVRHTLPLLTSACRTAPPRATTHPAADLTHPPTMRQVRRALPLRTAASVQRQPTSDVAGRPPLPRGSRRASNGHFHTTNPSRFVSRWSLSRIVCVLSCCMLAVCCAV